MSDAKQRPRDPEQWTRRSTEKYRKYRYSVEFRPGQAFFDLADPLVQSKRTLLSYDRLYVFWQVIHNVANVPGVVAEIGSYRGGSAYFVASRFASVIGEEVPMHVFDTFEGHPEQAITEHDPFHEAGKFSKTSYEDVRAYLSSFQLLQVHKGDVSASLPHLEEAAYRLVHIDTDLYQPTIACLEYFAPRMSPRGVIVVDDYASPKCAGVPKAVVEYLEGTDAFDVWDMRTEQLMLVKR
jgi:O-methyltransferase